MAKDMLTAIYSAEEECRQREANAKSKALEIAQKAEEDGAALIKASEKDAEEKARKLLEKAKANAEAELLKAQKTAEKHCSEISSRADANRARVIKSAAARLIG